MRAQKGPAKSCLSVLAIGMAIAGCDQSSPVTTDAGRDGGPITADGTASMMDGAVREQSVGDASGDRSAFVDASLADSIAIPICETACNLQTLTASFGQVNGRNDRAYYGIEIDAQGNFGLYVEAMRGGATGCPEQSSPTPEWTVVISGLPVPSQGQTVSGADGVAVSLFDYTGTLLPNSPLAKASSATVSFWATDICTDCRGKAPPSDPDGYVALELDATFAQGTIKGHLYATHCDSLDR